MYMNMCGIRCICFIFHTAVGRSQHVYRVVCRELGEQTLTISVGNGATLKNQFPSSETASAKYV